jgi:hypothetical protein
MAFVLDAVVDDLQLLLLVEQVDVRSNREADEVRDNWWVWEELNAAASGYGCVND